MLITPDEERRLNSIIRAGTNCSEADLFWLFSTVRRLVRVKPTEEAFEPIAALSSPASAAVFALRLVGAVPFERETFINEGHPAQVDVFDITTENPVCDAYLCIRPYIRLLEPHDEKMLSRLARDGRIQVDIDGERVIDGGSAEEHLVGPDGYGLRRIPFYFHPSPGGVLFGAGVPENQTTDHMTVQVQIKEGTKRGIFLPNGSRVMIWLSGITLQEGESLRLSTGLVMGHYTTRDAPFTPTPRPERRPSRKAWDPRD